MLPDDLPAVTRFDALLDALADDQPTGPFTGGLDPELVMTTLQLHASAFAPKPDAAFARELRQSLLVHSNAVPAAMTLRGNPRLGAARMIAIPDWRRGGWWPRAELAGMLLLVASVLIILSSGGQWARWPGTNKPGNAVTGTSFQASPVPTEIAIVNPFDPSACPSEPIGATDALATVGTANPTVLSAQTLRPATGDTGTPADDALGQTITETVQRFLACRNTDDMSRILPYSTPKLVQTLIANPLPGSTWMFYPLDAQASPVPLPPNRWITAVSISGVRLISNDLASATVVLRQPVDGYGTNAIVTTRWYFELRDGTWLIDESVEVAPITLETPTAEPTPISQSAATDYRMVTTTDVHLRAEPSTDAEVVDTVGEGAIVVVTGDPEEADGYVWLPVTVVDSGMSGWIVEDWVTSVDGEADADNTRGSTGQPPFLIGDQVQTSKPATIYAEPSQSSKSVVTVPGQTTVILTGPAVWDGADRWWPVEVALSGVHGYILESSLRPNTSPSTATASPSSTRFTAGANGEATPNAETQPVGPTPTSTATPVIRPKEDSHDVIVFLIDRSGSTSYDPLGGIAKLDLEKETIRRTIAALPDGTSVGVIAFNDRHEWAVPVTKLADDSRAQIVEGVNEITAEGGSFLTPVLLNLTGEPRTDPIVGLSQIVLLGDGKFGDHNLFAYRDVIQGLVRGGATFSTIAFGGDADTATMQTLAEYGNGLYHLVETETDIPTLTIDKGVLVAT